MLDLRWLAPFDNRHLLPKSGYLYFYCSNRGDGGARYFEGSQNQLRRLVREHDSWFWKGVTLSRCRNQTESIRERYDEDGSWNYFAGTEVTKLFGIPSHCQKGEREILRDLKSSVLLLQIGWDVTGEGCMLYSILPNDLKRKRFDKVKGQWAQS